MNKKAGIAVQVLVIMIVVILTSALIFSLVKFGVISVSQEYSQEDVLNAEFLPYGREGSLVIKDFKFCDYVDESYICLGEQSQFNVGSEIYFVFLVETSTYNRQIMLLENYRIKSPGGKVILDVDQKKDFNFEAESQKEKELVAFRDSFTILPGQELGEYTLELVVENPLLDKKTTMMRGFEVGKGVFEE